MGKDKKRAEEDKVPKPRSVACCVLVRPQTKEFLVVSSRRHEGKMVFPKGGVEKKETAVEASLREAWEEAGLLPENFKTGSIKHVQNILTAESLAVHKKASSDSEDHHPASIFHFELFETTSDDVKFAADWLESHERTLRWVAADEIEEVLKAHSKADDMGRGARAAKAHYGW